MVVEVSLTRLLSISVCSSQLSLINSMFLIPNQRHTTLPLSVPSVRSSFATYAHYQPPLSLESYGCQLPIHHLFKRQARTFPPASLVAPRKNTRATNDASTHAPTCTKTAVDETRPTRSGLPTIKRFNGWQPQGWRKNRAPYENCKPPNPQPLGE